MSRLISYQDAGYNYINIDDCYSEKTRNSEGDIVASAYKSHISSICLLKYR